MCTTCSSSVPRILCAAFQLYCVTFKERCGCARACFLSWGVHRIGMGVWEKHWGKEVCVCVRAYFSQLPASSVPTVPPFPHAPLHCLLVTAGMEGAQQKNCKNTNLCLDKRAGFITTDQQWTALMVLSLLSLSFFCSAFTYFPFRIQANCKNTSKLLLSMLPNLKDLSFRTTKC